MYYLSNARGASPHLGLLDRARNPRAAGMESYEVKRTSPYIVRNYRPAMKTPSRTARSAPANGRGGLHGIYPSNRQVGNKLDMFFRTPKPPSVEPRPSTTKERIGRKRKKRERPTTSPRPPPKLELALKQALDRQEKSRGESSTVRAWGVNGEGPHMISGNMAVVHTPRDKYHIENQKTKHASCSSKRSKSKEACCQTSDFPWEAWGKVMALLVESDRRPETERLPEEMATAANIEMIENLGLLKRENEALRSRLLGSANESYEKPPVWFESHSRENRVLRERLLDLMKDYKSLENIQASSRSLASTHAKEMEAAAFALEVREKELDAQAEKLLSVQYAAAEVHKKATAHHESVERDLREKIKTYEQETAALRRRIEATELQFADKLKRLSDEHEKVNGANETVASEFESKLQVQAQTIHDLDFRMNASREREQAASAKVTIAEARVAEWEQKCRDAEIARNEQETKGERQLRTIKSLEARINEANETIGTLKSKLKLAEEENAKASAHASAAEDVKTKAELLRTQEEVKLVRQRVSATETKYEQLEKEKAACEQEAVEAKQLAAYLKKELSLNKEEAEKAEQNFTKRASESAARERNLTKQLLKMKKELKRRQMSPQSAAAHEDRPVEKDKGGDRSRGEEPQDDGPESMSDAANARPEQRAVQNEADSQAAPAAKLTIPKMPKSEAIIKLQNTVRKRIAHRRRIHMLKRVRLKAVTLYNIDHPVVSGRFERADMNGSAAYVREDKNTGDMYIISRMKSTNIDADVWMLNKIDSSSGKAETLFANLDESDIASYGPPAAGWVPVGETNASMGSVPLLSHHYGEKKPKTKSVAIVSGAGVEALNLPFEAAGESGGAPSFEASAGGYDYFLRRIESGDSPLWIFAGKPADGEGGTQVYYVNAELGGLMRPPPAAWVLGQDGIAPVPSVKMKQVTYDETDGIVRRLSTMKND